MTPVALLTYPDINPVAIEFGPISVKWYGLAYMAGLLLGWLYIRLMEMFGLARVKHIAPKPRFATPKPAVDPETLQAVSGHRFADTLDEPGEDDVSAHVDFAALAST